MFKLVSLVSNPLLINKKIKQMEEDEIFYDYSQYDDDEWEDEEDDE